MFSIDDINTVITNNGKTIKVDLTNYTKVGHTHKIVDVSDLEEQLANKATTNHTHTIAEIKDLRTELNGKSDTTHTHDILTISNYQKLNQLEDVNILNLSLGQSLDDKEYTISVDSNSNLNIYKGESRIGQYLAGTNDWILANYSLKDIDTILENHYDALVKLKQVLVDAGIIVINSTTSTETTTETTTETETVDS